ncbi:MAG TPA: HEAT repeat domain-containing protein [Kofleriaceae bacterium]
MVVATYPGTVSPLRGLDPFGEAERDVWYGREDERDAIAKMVSGDQFRSGLVYGEPGVGKTSLIRAGLIPHLRDHGIVALACEDLSQPAASFAAGLSAFGIQPNANEAPAAFATRAVTNAVAGQQFVFVVDDIDVLCQDDRAVGELADLYQRVVSRSAGRARFLFICASERQHLIGALERRTGSLFPPSSRYELLRIPVQKASSIFDRMLSLSGVAADPPLAEAVVQGISRGQPLLAADLQISGMAMRDLKISSLSGLQKAGGPAELESEWLHEACRATGNERSGLRLCAELAATNTPRTATELTKRINLDLAYGEHALDTLEQRGVISRADANGKTWVLRHEVLAPRVRELTAPARAAARRGFDLLGSKTQNNERLKLSELRALRTEGIAAVTPEERAVIERSKRYYMTIAAAIAAAPFIILIIIWFSMRGKVYFDLEPHAGGDRIVVRYGRAGLKSFHWLPGGFGDEVADTGLTRPMAAPEAWKKISTHDIGSSASGWSDQLMGLMAPQLSGLVDFATTGNENVIGNLAKQAKDPEDLAELLTLLRPIARGSAAEVQLVEQALKTPSPAVQRAAVATAGAAAQRRNDVYQDTLSAALLSPDAELRRIAFSAVRGLGDRGHALFQHALESNPDADVRRELMLEVATAAPTVTNDDGPSLANMITLLGDAEAAPALRERAKAQIKAALVKTPDVTAAELTKLIAQDRAPAEARIFAIGLLRDLDPAPKGKDTIDAVVAAYGSRSAAVKAAALPLFAKLDPERAGGDLSTMLEDAKIDKNLKIAEALAWGEVAVLNKGAASNALDKLLADPDNDVRAAAATAAGKAGRTYLEKLMKMAKAESYPVRVGAAWGLAEIAESPSPGISIGGIGQLWKDKGRPRRDAAKIFAAIARKKPALVLNYLQISATIGEDDALHPIGVEGLCNGALAGSAEARRLLAKATDDESADVRKLVMSCVADGPDPAKNGAVVAAKLISDPSSDIRADAARVLAMSAAKGNKTVGEALVKLLDDTDRDVRVIAIRAVGGLGEDAPKTAAPILMKKFERGDEAEKLALLRAAKAIGASELIAVAVADSSPIVRVEAVDAALTSGKRAKETLSAALADADPQVRKAALERLAAQKDKLEPAVIERTLALAVRDPNPELSQLALTTVARVAPKDAVAARLTRSLGSRAERERAQAAAAAIGLVDRDAALTAQLLEPLLDDPSHDVRVAMLPALAAAYAKINEPEKLAGILRDSETNAMRRIVVAAAFITLARTDAGKAATEAALGKLVKDDQPPLARHTAKLVGGLIGSKADGMSFLQELIP